MDRHRLKEVAQLSTFHRGGLLHLSRSGIHLVTQSLVHMAVCMWLTSGTVEVAGWQGGSPNREGPCALLFALPAGTHALVDLAAATRLLMLVLAGSRYGAG